MADRHSDKRGLFGLSARRLPPVVESPSRNSSSAPPQAAPAAVNDVQWLSRNLKALAAAATHPPIRYAEASDAELGVIDMNSRPAVLGDIARPSFAYWAEAMQCAVRPHRKLWELVVVMQALYEGGILTKGARVLGFGVGDEPLPSYLASLGLDVVATDLADIADRERFFRPSLLAAETFDRHVEVSILDIRQLDDKTLRGFDGLWSCSVLNALQSPEQAADAVIEAMDLLRPGGVAVHTTEFSFAEDWPAQAPGALFFPRRFFESLTEGLNGRGHRVMPLSFDLGGHPLDAYVDLDPYDTDGPEALRALWREGLDAPHLKVVSRGVQTTSFALIVKRRP